MAEARLTMTYVVPHLLPNDQTKARNLTRDLFNHLVKIDQAAKDRNSQLALSNYQAAFSDIDKFLELLPQTSPQVES
jgi:photosystem II protein PsbQ